MAKFTLPWENALRIAFNLKDADPDASKSMVEECITEYKNIETQLENLKLELYGRLDILAVGETPEDATDNYAEKQGLFREWKMNTLLRGKDIEQLSPEFDWGFEFVIGEEEFIACGYNLDNHSLLTWFK